jgi:lipopolysaccharide heptosyltransferase II
MTAPAIAALTAAHPGRRITLLTSPEGAAAAGLVPAVDAVLASTVPWMKHSPAGRNSRAEYALAAELRRRRFDGAVIFCVYSQSPLPAAFLCHLADIPLRLAYCHENPYHLLSHWVPDPEPGQLVRHEVRRHLDLVASVGCFPADERIALSIPESARTQVRILLHAAGLPAARPWIAIHPGSSAPSRRYPPEQFAAAADRLAAATGYGILFTGAAGEQPLIDMIRGLMRTPAHSLAGRLTLPELAALIDRTPLLITNNTGPAHIAAATGTPVVVLYALTNPQHAPWKAASRVLSHDVPCRYCYKSVCPERHNNCLRLISPDDVVRAAYELLETARPPVHEDNNHVYSRHKCNIP